MNPETRKPEILHEQTYWQLLQDHGKSKETIDDMKRAMEETIRDAIRRINPETQEGPFLFRIEAIGARVMSFEELLKMAAYKQMARDMGYEIELITRNRPPGSINGKIRKIEKKL